MSTSRIAREGKETETRGEFNGERSQLRAEPHLIRELKFSWFWYREAVEPGSDRLCFFYFILFLDFFQRRERERELRNTAVGLVSILDVFL